MRLRTPLQVVLRQADRRHPSLNRVISSCSGFDNGDTNKSKKNEVEFFGNSNISIIPHKHLDLTPLIIRDYRLHLLCLRHYHQALNKNTRRSFSTSRPSQAGSNHQLSPISSPSYESSSLEFLWGGSGLAMSAMHGVGVPYWGTCALLAFSVRTALLPIAIHGASAAADLAKVSPEVQFLVSMYQRDVVKLRDIFNRLLFLENVYPNGAALYPFAY